MEPTGRLDEIVGDPKIEDIPLNSTEDLFSFTPKHIRRDFLQLYLLAEKKVFAITINPREQTFGRRFLQDNRYLFPKHFICAERDDKGREHFHGIFKSSLTWPQMLELQDRITTACGMCKIKVVGKNNIGWFRYMFKDSEKAGNPEKPYQGHPSYVNSMYVFDDLQPVR